MWLLDGLVVELLVVVKATEMRLARVFPAKNGLVSVDLVFALP